LPDSTFCAGYELFDAPEWRVNHSVSNQSNTVNDPGRLASGKYTIRVRDRGCSELSGPGDQIA